ncbi:hypothetical protein BaRGS_00011966, partial [Batillaria attramentaria]
DEAVNTVPSEVYFAIKADLDLTVGSRVHYVSRSQVGIVGAQISLKKKDLRGAETELSGSPHSLNGPRYCQATVSATRPVIKGSLHDCEGTIQVPNLTLRDGESLCADMQASSGGYYDLQNENSRFVSTETFRPVTKSKKVCFLYDPTKPTHRGDTQNILHLSTRLTRTPEISVHIEGWEDPIPSGGTHDSVSGIEKYRIEVHGVDTGTVLSVQEYERNNHTLEWQPALHAIGGPFDRLVTLPEEDAARLYAIILEVHDKAGNVNYARRLLLYDNTSTVEIDTSAPFYVVFANNSTNLRWQTDVSKKVCVNWKGRFYNNELRNNDFLKPVKPDNGREIHGDYDQQSGLLPVNGTDNVMGIVKFEMAWSRDNSERTPWVVVHDLHAQTTCVQEPIKDGETYDVWIRATDIMDNNKEDKVRVSIDHTGPSVSIEGLRGRFGREGLYVHNPDLSSMLLLVHASDPHGGIKILMWQLGTRDLADDVGSGAVDVHRLNCEIHRYLLDFIHLASTNASIRKHNREYYITITATNNAILHSRQMIDILIDASPPTEGVVLEGLSDDDQDEMDFTSSDVVHVRWHGFLDHESGILLYRVVLADRCLTDEEMDAAQDAVKVEEGNMTTLTFPSGGRFFTNVVAYNGAMEPSAVACSDGITKAELCPAGHYVNSNHDFTCTPCPVNTYAETPNQKVCNNCPDGLKTDNDGSDSLADCKAPEGGNITASIDLKYVLLEICTVTSENSVRTSLQAKIVDLNSDLHNVCLDLTCTNAHVTASCDGLFSHSVTAVVSLTDLPGTFTSSTSGVTMTTKDMLQAATNDGDVFNLSTIGAELRKDEVAVSVMTTCTAGYRKSGDDCEPVKAEASLISSELLGTVVGGSVGVVALVVLTIVVVKLMRNGRPSTTATPNQQSPPDHTYSALTTLQRGGASRTTASSENADSVNAVSSLDHPYRTVENNAENDYDYLDVTANESGSNVISASSMYLTPSGGQPTTSPAQSNAKVECVNTVSKVEALPLRSATPGNSSVKFTPQAKQPPPVMPKPKLKKAALPGSDHKSQCPERMEGIRFRSESLGSCDDLPAPTPHVTRSSLDHITHTQADDDVRGTTQQNYNGRGNAQQGFDRQIPLTPLAFGFRQQDFGLHSMGALRHDVDLYIPPADYET